VAAPTDAPASARAAARHAGPLIVAGTGHVSLEEVLAELGRAGHDSVLCEGGPGLFVQLAQADLLDEVCVTISPLLVAGGAGAASRHSIGTTVFFGMLVATAIAIIFIPLFFRVIRGLAERGETPAAAGQEAP
jgi:hypothetical protein